MAAPPTRAIAQKLTLAVAVCCGGLWTTGCWDDKPIDPPGDAGADARPGDRDPDLDAGGQNGSAGNSSTSGSAGNKSTSGSAGRSGASGVGGTADVGGTSGSAGGSGTAGSLGENTSCGFANRRYVEFADGEGKVFPFAAGDVDQSLYAVVTAVDLARSLDDRSTVRLEGDGETFTILTEGISTLGVDVGDNVKLSWKHFESPPYPPSTQLTLRVDGELVFHYVKARELPPGFTYTWGADQCSGSMLCYRWTAKAVRVTGPCGDTIELASNARGRLCDYEVVAGTLQERAPERFEDTCYSHVFVGLELTFARITDDRDAGL